ncbi:hypothetical protein GGS21DRAFT_489057 [Xylaria nigripes]|nr:hypothetical protein GGS21DRAFT_489057 [Xylaria nigripes]
MDKKLMLPQDIMLLICQELGARREFTTLYRFSFLSRRTASIALEQLYGILEVMDSFIEDKRQAARLWKSIVLSSLGVTLYPYCAYLRVLSLGSLIWCLTDIRSDHDLREFFFGGLTKDLLVSGRECKLYSTKEIASICADRITKYIRMLADNSGIAMALTHLEGDTIALTCENFTDCISRLSALKSLQLEDGCFLTMEVGMAIAKYCPNFTELVCFHYTNETAAMDMAGFFLALRPNSLRRFEVHSANGFNNVTIAALNNTHAKSLRVLHLRSLRIVPHPSGQPLSQCTSLESLLIENDVDRSGLNFPAEPIPNQLAQWISSCKALRELSLIHVPEALEVLKEVLQTPEIRLEQLIVQDYESASDDDEKIIWNALGLQDRLKQLTIASQDSAPDSPILYFHPELTDSICRLSNLTALNLMQAWVSTAEVNRFCTSLPHLEELSFGGDIVNASILEHLSTLPKLTSLSITALTAFRFHQIRRFAQRLDPVTNRGIRVDLLNQWFDARLTERQVARLNEFFADRLNGQISIVSPDDPVGFSESESFDSD